MVLEPVLRREIVELSNLLGKKPSVYSASCESISSLLDEDMALGTPAGLNTQDALKREKLIKVFLQTGKQVGAGTLPPAFSIHKAIYATMHTTAVLHVQSVAVRKYLEKVAQPSEITGCKLTLLGQEPILVIASSSVNQAAEAIKESAEHFSGVFIEAVGLFTWGMNLAMAYQQFQRLEDAAAGAPVLSIPKAKAGVASQAQVAAVGTTPSPNQNVMCNGCGRCTNSGGCLPSAGQQAAKSALRHLSEEALVALIAEATQEVLKEQGLI